MAFEAGYREETGQQLMQPNVSDSRKAAAYHEAGHAVVACVENIAVKRASILPDHESLGRVLHSVPDSFRPDIMANCRTRTRAEALILGSLAGPKAEERATGAESSFDSKAGDYHSAMDMALRMTGNAKEAELYFAWLDERTASMVEAKWPLIEAVAKELLSREVLPGREVRRIILQAIAEGARRRV